MEFQLFQSNELPVGRHPVEYVERKGLGHPDSICDSVMECAAQALRAEYQALSAKIEDLTLNYTARAGDKGKLYGSITTAQIADDLNELLGTEIDRRKVGSEPLRQLGKHKVVVRLSADFQPHVSVVIESEDGATFVEEVEVVEEIDEVETLDETLEDTEAIVDDIEEELEEEDYWDEFDSDELG